MRLVKNSCGLGCTREMATQTDIVNCMCMCDTQAQLSGERFSSMRTGSPTPYTKCPWLSVHALEARRKQYTDLCIVGANGGDGGVGE